MTAPAIGFTGFESGEESASWNVLGDGDSVQSGTALAGTYSLEVDPVNANATFKFYGVQLVFPKANTSTTRLQSLFHFRMPAVTLYDELVGLYELAGPGLNLSRRLVLRNTDAGSNPDKLMLVDKDEDIIATGSNTLVAGANYLIRVDTQLNKDVVYLYDIDDSFGGGAIWYTEIDADDWGDIVTPFTFITFGTILGKTLPTVGDPFYIDEICVLDMEGSTPSADSIGSVLTRLKGPTGVSGDNNDFSGASADVDEIPNDGDTTNDESGTVGHIQGYDVADATGAEVPLACQIVGYAARNSGSADADIDYKYGFYRPTGAVFDMSDTIVQHQAAYRPLGTGDASGGAGPEQARTIWNDFNGSPWTNPIFDEIEVTVEVITANNSAKFRLTNIHATYYVEGAVASPADFPDAPTATGTGVDDVSISIV